MTKKRLDIDDQKNKIKKRKTIYYDIEYFFDGYE